MRKALVVVFHCTNRMNADRCIWRAPGGLPYTQLGASWTRRFVYACSRLYDTDVLGGELWVVTQLC